MADECADVMLSRATDPLKAKDLRADILERACRALPPYCDPKMPAEKKLDKLPTIG
jgi:hypothetical protein